MTIADLPGYGFAYASEESKQSWTDAMQFYFANRHDTLRLVYMLIDSRHGLMAKDMEMAQFLTKYVEQILTLSQRCQVPYRFVFTKTDLVFVEDLARVLFQTKQFVDANKDSYSFLVREIPNAANLKEETFAIFASAKRKSGIQCLRNEMAAHATMTAEVYEKKNKIGSFL